MFNKTRNLSYAHMEKTWNLTLSTIFCLNNGLLINPQKLIWLVDGDIE